MPAPAATTRRTVSDNAGRKPDFKLEAFPIKLSGWKREHDGRTFYTLKLQRTYKDDKTGRWEHTDGLDARDLPVAASLLLRAHMELGITKEGA